MAMNAVSFFLRRTRSSQKDAARLQKLLSCLSVCGGRQRENFFGGGVFFGCFLFWCKISVLDPTPTKATVGFFLFFFERGRRE